MGLFSREGFTTQAVTLAKAVQGIGGGRGECFLSKHTFQALDHKIFDRGPATGGGNFRPFQEVIRQINGRFHTGQ